MTVVALSLVLRVKQLHYTLLTPEASQAPQHLEQPPRLAPVVFIHGLGSSQNFHHHVAMRVSKQTGRVCLLLDNEGAGRSPLVSSTLDVAVMAANVMGLLRELALPRCVLVGHSMGGMLASYLLAHEPEAFEAAVLLGPVHPTETVASIFGARISTVLEAGSMDAMANTVPLKALGTQATGLQRAFVRELLMAQLVAGYAANCSVIQHAGDTLEALFVKWYQQITHPVMIVQGEQDSSAPWAGCVEVIARHLRHGTVTQLPGVGHWHCIEAEEEVFQVLVAFISKLE